MRRVQKKCRPMFCGVQKILEYTIKSSSSTSCISTWPTVAQATHQSQIPTKRFLLSLFRAANQLWVRYHTKGCSSSKLPGKFLPSGAKWLLYFRPQKVGQTEQRKKNLAVINLLIAGTRQPGMILEIDGFFLSSQSNHGQLE